MQPRLTGYNATWQRLTAAFHPYQRVVNRLGKFLIVGGAGVAVNMAALFALHELARLPLVPSVALAVEIAIINNFFWNNLWTFRQPTLSLRRFIKFNLASLAGMFIATTTVWLLSTAFDVHYLVANLAAIGLASTWNFAASLLWTWG